VGWVADLLDFVFAPHRHFGDWPADVDVRLRDGRTLVICAPNPPQAFGLAEDLEEVVRLCPRPTDEFPRRPKSD
jgi:hypothetical protein